MLTVRPTRFITGLWPMKRVVNNGLKERKDSMALTTHTSPAAPANEYSWHLCLSVFGEGTTHKALRLQRGGGQLFLLGVRVRFSVGPGFQLSAAT